MRAVLVIGIAFVALSCGGQSDSAGGTPGAAQEATPGATGGGSITGTVMFAGTAAANPVIDMADEPQCRQKYGEAPRDPIVLVENRRLANVFVYITSGLPDGARYPTPSTPVVVDQDGCLYEPRVVGVMAGQPVEIRNSDPLLHNVKAVPTENRGFNRSQATAGQSFTQTFTRPEVMVPLECNVHGWMKGYIGVVAHPFHAVTGSDGSFRLEGLPAGTYTVEAWHERFGTRTATVTVPADGSATTEISFTPAA